MNQKLGLIFFVSFITSFNLFGGGINGTVKSADGTLLPFATIFIKGTSTGTSTNADGYYEIPLVPGSYQVIFQYLGFESVSKSIQVAEGFTSLDIILKPQAVLLREVTIKGVDEDPAYTIIRKAVAKSKYHLQQLDHYTARVYIKGAGRLKDAPFFLRKRLKKEGIDPDAAYALESVSDIEYQRPGIYKEKVISIRKIGNDNSTPPNAYINGSFYEPEVGETVSPLSPKAFSYYRFEYVGTFNDRGYDISKIKVTPRSKGDNVFKGFLYIVEDYWSIHSLNFKTTKLGIDIQIKQICAPIENKAWMPVSHQFEVEGSYLGFDFEYDYLATVSNYKITLNPDLDVELEVVDEKIEKELADSLDQVLPSNVGDLQKKLESGKEITRKELRKVLREYEKASLQQTKEPQVVSNKSFKVDSAAYERDSTYWASVRTIPLTKYEVKGYQKMDSISIADSNQADSLGRKRKKGFQVLDILFGDTYAIGNNSSLTIRTIQPYFNTVEGFNLTQGLFVSKKLDSTTSVSLGTLGRYSFSRKKLIGIGFFRLNYGKGLQKGNLTITGGRYVQQINNSEPIHPLINTFTTLFLEGNYMKIYEKGFSKLLYKKGISDNFSLTTTLEWATRRQLSNNSDYKFVDRKGEGYSSNAPENISLPNTSFPDHDALLFSLELNYRPWQKYNIRNGKKHQIIDSSPLFKVNYNKGIASSDVDFDHLQFGVKHRFSIGVRGKVDIATTVGGFLNKKNLYFLDFQHFLGNLSPFQSTDPVGSFRLLDYYKYSTVENYFTGHLHYQFRKFMITQIMPLRFLGVRENLIFNYLGTNKSGHYTEIGYGINYILRILRVEAITSFQDGRYKGFGVRVGIAANLDNIF